jgi:hypothetical protein
MNNREQDLNVIAARAIETGDRDVAFSAGTFSGLQWPMWGQFQQRCERRPSATSIERMRIRFIRSEDAIPR